MSRPRPARRRVAASTRGKAKAAYAVVSVGPVGFVDGGTRAVRAQGSSMAIRPRWWPTWLTPKGDQIVSVLTDEQKVQVRVKYYTQAGNPAEVNGAPAWEVADGTILAAADTDYEVVDVGGAKQSVAKGWVVTQGPLGPCQVAIRAQEGAENKEILTLVEFEVVAADAASGKAEVGEPVLKAEPPGSPATRRR